MLQKIQIENYPGAEEGWKYFEQVETPAGWIKLGEHQQYDISVRGPSFILHGGGGRNFVADKLFLHFNQVRRRSKNFKFYYMFIYFKQNPLEIIYLKKLQPLPPLNGGLFTFILSDL